MPSKARQPKELNQPQESKASCASSTPAKAKGKEAASAAAGGGGGKTSTPTGAKETGATTSSSSSSVPNGSFRQKKDQGWGELLDLKRVKRGDTICPPPKSRNNKGRQAQVQHDGSLLKNDTESCIDPVAFCVRNNSWKESDSFLKDRNRFSNCIRICANTQEEERLHVLKDKARGFDRGRQTDGEDHHVRQGATNLAPVQGATVKVRMEVDKKIMWLDAKLTRLNENGAWDIKLQFCDEAPKERQGQCTGCSGCLFKLAPDDRGW